MHEFLKPLGIEAVNSGVYTDRWVDAPGGGQQASRSPIDGKPIAEVKLGARADYDAAVGAAQAAFAVWRQRPAPKRGELVREIADALRREKEALGALVSLEMGKIRAEGEGEVQEMIDIADFAVGLSRQLYGLSMHSERPGHRMYEQWHPLGVVGIITAFNFPVAVWAWNAMIAAVCGNAMIWKPSPKTPLCAVAIQNLIAPILRRHEVPGLMSTVVGGIEEVGEPMIADPRLPLISATGSTRMGRRVGAVVAERFGRSLLELGGNNAIIATAEADVDLLVRAVLFGAVGTAGQRCTTTRRLIVHQSLAGEVTERLVRAYGQVKIGDPLAAGTLMGPLIDAQAVENMQRALTAIREQGGEVLCGGERLSGEDYPGGCYVTPAIVRAPADLPMMQEETFAPILYVVAYDALDDALAWHNGVQQGLSSAMFTRDLVQAETFLSAMGSDCGIANINIGTSGAEIGGAFGGEKETGGGREAGSDSWKTYMRRQTCTINWSGALPLAQGIEFG